jgi:hypothetical protein
VTIVTVVMGICFLSLPPSLPEKEIHRHYRHHRHEIRLVQCQSWGFGLTVAVTNRDASKGYDAPSVRAAKPDFDPRRFEAWSQAVQRVPKSSTVSWETRGACNDQRQVRVEVFEEFRSGACPTSFRKRQDPIGNRRAI